MSFDVYAWKAPRSLDADAAGALVDAWEEAGGDPSQAPFEPSTDVGWFYRELTKEFPDVDAQSDGVPDASKLPIWLSTDQAPPARLVAVRLEQATAREVLESIAGLATKYDLMLFNPRGPSLRAPFEEMAAYASATFWPRGAIRGAVAGIIGGVIAVVAWFVGIPLLSGVLVLIGGFLVVLTVVTFASESRKRWRAR
jgi:hypothetical protein